MPSGNGVKRDNPTSFDIGDNIVGAKGFGLIVSLAGGLVYLSIAVLIGYIIYTWDKRHDK
jgi:hypothetical protein